MSEDTRFLLSLGAMVLGWWMGFLSLVVYCLVSTGYVTDLIANFITPGLFILLCWPLIFLPILRWVPPGHRLFEPRISPWFGAVLGAVVYFALVQWWAHFRGSDFSIFLLYSVVTGATAGAVYAFGHRALLRRTLSKEPCR